MNDALLEAVRELRVAEPDFGVKPLLAKLREQQPELGAATKEVREALADAEARIAAQSGDAYSQLLAEGAWYASKEDTRRAARAFGEAIALNPDRPVAYYNLGATLGNSGHLAEAAPRYLEAMERYRVGSEKWAKATAWAFDVLRVNDCDEVAKPEWWNDQGLKALSARVVRAAPNAESALDMRAHVLSGEVGGWEAGPRSAAELKEAATHYDRSAALCPAPAWKAKLSEAADWCRSEAELPLVGCVRHPRRFE
jgi:tetratricopeptide (TPR) repeat protein